MSIIDYILPEDRDLYNAIIERVAEAKANAPKERKPRAPLTEEQRQKRDIKRLAFYEKKLAELRAAQEAQKAQAE